MTPSKAAKAPAAGPSPDAELLRLCSDFIALEQAAIAGWEALGAELEQAEKNHDEIIERQEALVELIGGMPARTDAGIVAKLRALAAFAPSLLKPEANLTEDLLLASALRDAAGIAEARPGPEQFQSARARQKEMVDACARAWEAQRKAIYIQREADRLRDLAHDLYVGFPAPRLQTSPGTGAKP